MSPILFGTANSQPRFSTPGLAYRAPLLNGEPGTAQTIALMRRLVDEALADPQFVRQAIEIVRAVPAYDDFAEAETLYRWVKRHIRFTKDPVTKEKLYPPQELLKIGAGDCDDIADAAWRLPDGDRLQRAPGHGERKPREPDRFFPCLRRRRSSARIGQLDSDGCRPHRFRVWHGAPNLFPQACLVPFR